MLIEIIRNVKMFINHHPVCGRIDTSLIRMENLYIIYGKYKMYKK